MFTIPALADFKAYFVRDFPYGTDSSIAILDADITSAIADAGVNFNQDLFANQTEFNVCYLLLAAHFLCTNIQASSQGIAGAFKWITGSNGVGSVSSSYNIPQKVMDSPELAMLCKTRYGAKYVMFMLPRITGTMFCSYGSTNA